MTAGISPDAIFGAVVTLVIVLGGALWKLATMLAEVRGQVRHNGGSTLKDYAQDAKEDARKAREVAEHTADVTAHTAEALQLRLDGMEHSAKGTRAALATWIDLANVRDAETTTRLDGLAHQLAEVADVATVQRAAIALEMDARTEAFVARLAAAGGPNLAAPGTYTVAITPTTEEHA